MTQFTYIDHETIKMTHYHIFPVFSPVTPICMLGNISYFCCHFSFFFSNSLFQKYSFKNTIRMSNGLDPDQDRLPWFWSRLFVTVISRRQKSPRARNEYHRRFPGGCFFYLKMFQTSLHLKSIKLGSIQTHGEE